MSDEGLEARVRALELDLVVLRTQIRTWLILVAAIVSIASPLLTRWMLVYWGPQPEPALTQPYQSFSPAGRVARIVSAMRELPPPTAPDGGAFYTNDGRPRVAVLSNRLGWAPSVAEADYAWELLERERGRR